MNKLKIKAPYLLFLGDTTAELDIKTAGGLAYWRPDSCTGEWSLPACNVSTGLEFMNPVTAVQRGAQSLVIGSAPVGGVLASDWIPFLVEALKAGLDIVSGLHVRLESVPELTEAAQIHGRELVNIRIPPENIPCGNGIQRSGKRLLMVGTDCCVGKKYSALALHQRMHESGTNCTFRALS